jgi:hypothetical protein
VTWVEVSPDGKTITRTWDAGTMVISSTHGYTESHVVKVIAFDAAGNKTESEKVRFYVIHKPKKKKGDASLYLHNHWQDHGPPFGLRIKELGEAFLDAGVEVCSWPTPLQRFHDPPSRQVDQFARLT